MPYYNSESPLREALIAILGKEPTLNLIGVRYLGDLNEEEQNSLYEWCTQNARPHWATGMSIIEAAELIVARAIENANI